VQVSELLLHVKNTSSGKLSTACVLLKARGWPKNPDSFAQVHACICSCNMPAHLLLPH
jgi:hypothetical protein